MENWKDFFLQQLRLGRPQEIFTLAMSTVMMYFISLWCVTVVQNDLSTGHSIYHAANWPIIYILSGAIISYYIPLRLTIAKLTLSTVVDIGIRFDSAMQILKINLNTDMLEFSKKNRLTYYMSSAPLPAGISNDVKGKIDPFAYAPFASSKYTYELVGKQRVFFKKSEFDLIAKNYLKSTHGAKAESVDLNYIDNQVEINSLHKQNKQLRIALRKVGTDKRMTSMRERKAEKAKNTERLASVLMVRVAARLASLHSEAGDYTYEQVKEELSNTLNHEKSFEELRNLIGTISQDIIDRVREGLLPLGMIHGVGRPKN